MIANAATLSIADVPTAPEPGAGGPDPGKLTATPALEPKLWRWHPATGEFRFTNAGTDDSSPGTLAAFLATVATADHERVTEALAAIAHTSSSHLDVSYDLRDTGNHDGLTRMLGHVVERDASGAALCVSGVVLAAGSNTPAVASRSGHSLDLGLAFEGPHQGVWEWNASDNRFAASAQWRELFGYSEEDIRNELCDVTRLAHPDDLKATRRALIALLRGTAERYEAQQRMRHRDGHYLPCLARARVIERDASGRAVRLAGTHTDISPIVETQDALTKSNATLSFALEHGRQGIWEWDCTTDAFKHYGHLRDRRRPAPPRTMATGTDLLACTHPDDRDGVLTALTTYLRGGTEDYEVEQRIAFDDDTYRTYLVRGRALERSAAGRIIRVLGSWTDITELKAAAERLQLALENGRQSMWEWTRENDALSFSASWSALYGGAKVTATSTLASFRDRIHPADRACAHEALTALLDGKQADYAVELRFLTESAGYIWIMERARILERDARGRAVHVAGTHVDITEQKTVEHELMQSKRLLALVIDTIPSLVYWKDTECRYLGVNRSFANAVGLDNPDDVIGLSDFDLPWKLDAAEFQRGDHRVLTRGEAFHQSDDVYTDQCGEEHHLDTVKTPLLDEYGETIGVLGVSAVVTAQRRYERQLEKFAERITGAAHGRLLDALTRAAAEMSGLAIAFVAKANDDRETATIISSYPEDLGLTGQQYDIEGSPCAELRTRELHIFPDNAHLAYPDDPGFAQHGVVAYIGRRLVGQNREPIGIIGLLGREPVSNPQHAVSVIDIMAATAAAELQREQRESALRESELRYRTTFDSVPVMICTLSDDGRIIDTNQAWYAATGYTAASTLGQHLAGFFVNPKQPDPRATQAIPCDFVEVTEDYLDLRCHDGSTIQVSYNQGRLAEPGSGGAIVAVLEDVSDKLFAEQQLRLAATAFETHEALAVRDANKRILRVNAAFRQITGYTDDDVIGRLPTHLESGDSSSAEAKIWAAVDANGQWDGERISYRADGTEFAAWQTITAVRDDDGKITHYVENSTDVSELKAALAEARKLSLFDPLTALPNRRYLSERLESSIAHARRNAIKGALLFIDLDQFKQINDSLGHSVGDELLVQVAKRLKRLMRKEDTIARLGGDEFVVILSDLGGDNEKCVEQASRVADKVHLELGKPYEVENHEFNVTPTIGVTLFPEDGKAADTILQEADSAMYQGKADGRNTTKFFHPNMRAESQIRLGLERDLRTAAERDELSLYFQPQYDRDGKLFAAETLLRWNHPSRGFVPPDLFIPIAEESGLIMQLSHWVFAAALDHLRRWERSGNLFIEHLAINVSSRQFRSSHFITEARREIVAAGVPADRIVIEVTEGTVIENFEETAERMRTLRDMGIRFSVDDFGVGYSSLSYLSRLPLDQLKIDRSFVSNVLGDPNNAVIAETIIGMGRNLKLHTIAEGVETRAQFEFLKQRGCDGFQGYLFSEPVPEAVFLTLPPLASAY